MPKIGESVGSGSEGTFSWNVTYVGGVGRGGQGKGVYNWEIEIRHKDKRDPELIAWMSGDDEDAAIRYAKLAFKDIAGIPKGIA